GNFPPNNQPGPEPEVIGWFFAVGGGIGTMVVWTYAAALVLAGRMLHRHRGRIFCLGMAAISCANVPSGTVLGVFTFSLLLRPNVMEMFDPKRRQAIDDLAGPSARQDDIDRLPDERGDERFRAR